MNWRPLRTSKSSLLQPEDNSESSAQPVHGARQLNWQPLRPSFLALLALITGLVASFSFNVSSPAPGVVLIMLPCIVVLLQRKRPNLSQFLTLFLGLGLLLQSPIQAQKNAALVAREALFAEPTELVQITGIVMQPVRSPLMGGSFWLAPGSTFSSRGRALTMPAPVPVWAFDLDQVNTWTRGARVSLIGQPRPLATHPSGPSLDSFLSNQGAVVGFQAKQVVTAQPAPLTPFLTIANTARNLSNAVEASYYRSLPITHASLLAAITLGRTGGLSPELRDATKRIGIAHIFAVSGLHTGIIGFGLFLLLRLALPEKLVPVVMVLAMLFFCAMVEFRPSAMRAAFFVSLLSFQSLLKRRFEPLSLLSSVALVLILFQPTVFWQVDFQMSFLCAAILFLLLPLFTPFVQELEATFRSTTGARWWGKPAAYVISTVVTSTLIQLILAPLLVRNMGEFSLISPIANTAVLFLMPFVLFASYASALLEIALGSAHLFQPLWFLAEFLLQTTQLLAQIPNASVTVPGDLPAWAIAFFYLLVAGSPWLLMRPAFRPTDGHYRLLYHSVLPATVLLVLMFVPRNSPQTRVLFLDVGQGDATAIIHHKQVILVDAGPPPGTQLLRELREYGVESIDLLAFTHADADHIGGFPALLESVPIREIWVNNTETTEALHQLLETEQLQNLPLPEMREVIQGSALELDSVTKLSVLHPDPAYQPENPRNDASLVFLLSHGSVDVLLLGDLEAHGEAHLLEEYGNNLSGIEILKVAHHGSRTSSTATLLSATQPVMALMSCGLNNRYQHPHADILARYNQLGIPVYRTDYMGTIALKLDSRTFSVLPERQLAYPQQISMPELFP